ncbi:hypothetical protein RJT34_30073 [Clitoria ternatea]|uniref:C2H2-type domain-containing protein n=1 Tax=Clitoria ternatea TaxID=43366 RepID=A0AAN9ERP6_CLITE
MESDHHDHHQPEAAASENPTDGEEYQQGASQVTSIRSYECNFCRRGFSNAQALGGHMNIHRKDKAKLKQQQQSSNQQPQQSLDKLSEPNVKQLHPLFAESPTNNSSETQKPQGQTTSSSSTTSQDPLLELDLELRLGTEPQDSPAATDLILLSYSSKQGRAVAEETGKALYCFSPANLITGF